MNITEFIRKLQADEFKILTHGHRVNALALKTQVLQKALFKSTYHQEALEDDTVSGNSIEYHKKQIAVLNSEDAYVSEMPLYSRDLTEVQCTGCGRRGLKVEFKDDNTLQIAHWDEGVFQCPAEHWKKMETTISVPTGELIFANHFGGLVSDTPEGMEHDDKYNLCSRAGRRERALYLANSNYGYGQVGNTSVYVFMHPESKKILITLGLDCILEDYEYYKDEEPDKITEELIKRYNFAKDLQDNWKSLGSLSLGVWRWMCAPAPLNDPDDVVSDERFVASVPAGDWKITHYYDYEPDPIIVSEMEFVDVKEDQV